MREVKYKGYVMHVSPQQLRDSGEWNMDIMISKDHGHSRAGRKFSASNTFKTEKEAVKTLHQFWKGNNRWQVCDLYSAGYVEKRRWLDTII